MSSYAHAAGGVPIGAYRNLTAAFLRYRDESRAHTRPPKDERARGEGARLLDGRGSSSEVELAGVGGGSVALNLPPDWCKYSEDAATTMGRIKERLAQLATLHARALLPNFDEFSGEDAKVEVLTQEITHLFKRTEKNLTALGARKGGDEGDAKVRLNVVRSMAAELQKLSVDFRKKQKDYLQKLKLTQDRGGGESDYDVGFTDHQIMQTNTIIDDVVARDQEVVKIIESVNELAAIMKDLSVLVIDQGTILDRIDYNVEQVAEKVAEGVKQIEQAEKTQKKSFILIVISLLFVLVIIMILVVAGKAMLRG